MKINNWISIAGRTDDGQPEFEDDSWFTKTARQGEDISLRGFSLQMWMMVVTQAVDVLLVKVSAVTSGNGQR